MVERNINILIDQIHNIINYDTNKVKSIKNHKYLKILFENLRSKPEEYHNRVGKMDNVNMYLSKSTVNFADSHEQSEAQYTFEFVTYNGYDIEIVINDNTIHAVYIKTDRYGSVHKI